ncbi:MULTISPECIES: hypothetical protein [unclassified Bosea (in: a-proteobacteria)]|uniref:hypothetical protein n=1 Tax=unclassified Bosea (in: a-proteobacteria) TaxID=2653178 RepID=UPI000F760185|nr:MULTISPECIES: hypothetical protein [unclassified Bosea (in: a-proteobacteria)]AZO82047.1 hypothetical protein BLM15_30105 [Bosea sp. Tri-49]RXT24620.1 hypothetical protein B5U98_08220 [Bosea sp. Tri-39]RXT42455.1 hypothetical protein B5U99_00690 [Bosea sp. Tri-54]
MSSLGGRIVLGALAGLVATLPMTIAMRRLHRVLPDHERYPLPPREIAEDLPSLGLPVSSATLLQHFLYGGAGGALFAGLFRRGGIAAGSGYGIAVWIGSYLGWVPAARILRPATQHPMRRNVLMLAVHLVWGACLAAGLAELENAERDSFSLSTSPNPKLKDRAGLQA